MKRNFDARRALPFVTAASVLIFDLLLARLLTDTDGRRVWIAGYELGGTCPFQEHFGAPCPFCGITRSVVLTLHGEFTRAVEFNVGGVMIVVGALLLCGAGVFLAASQINFAETRRHETFGGSFSERTRTRIAYFFASYAGLTFFVTLAQWLHRLSLV